MTRRVTRQELMVLRHIPSHNESQGVLIGDLGEALRASPEATYSVLARLCDKQLVRTDTVEFSNRSRLFIRSDSGDHIFMKHALKLTTRSTKRRTYP